MISLQWPPIAIGIALLIALLTALWKAARLRGDANREWASRLALVEAGLLQRATQVLAILRNKIDLLVAGRDGVTDPLSPTVNPAPLLKFAREFAQCIAAQRRAKFYFQALMSLGYFAGIALMLLIVCDVLATLHFGNVVTIPKVLPWVAKGAIVGIALGALVLTAQWYLQQALTNAEILSAKQDVDSV